VGLSKKSNLIDSDDAIILVMGSNFFIIGFVFHFDSAIHSVKLLSSALEFSAPYLGISFSIIFLAIGLTFFMFFIYSWLTKRSRNKIQQKIS